MGKLANTVKRLRDHTQAHALFVNRACRHVVTFYDYFEATSASETDSEHPTIVYSVATSDLARFTGAGESAMDVFRLVISIVVPEGLCDSEESMVYYMLDLCEDMVTALGKGAIAPDHENDFARLVFGRFLFDVDVQTRDVIAQLPIDAYITRV